MPTRFYAELLRVAAREVDPKRLDTDRLALLELATHVTGRDESAALLWLYDDDPLGLEEIRLSYAFDAAETNQRPTALRKLALLYKTEPSPDRVLNWFRANHPGVEPQETWLNIGSAQFPIGRLQVLSPAGRGTQDERLSLVAQVLTDTITAERRERPALAVRRFQAATAAVWDMDKILQALADVVHEFTTAQSAIVYRPTGATEKKELVAAALTGSGKASPSLIKSLTASPDSLTYDIFKRRQLVRLADISDQDEVMRRCGRRSDPTMLARLHRLVGRARAWMVATVRVRSYEAEQGILLIKLLNKSGSDYLHNNFTRTDASILTALIEFLTTFLPWTESVLAQRETARALVSLPKTDQTDPLRVIETMASALSHHILGLTGLCFYLPGMEPLASTGAANMAKLRWRGLDPATLYHLGDDPRQSFVIVPLGESALVAQFCKTDLPVYEFEILAQFAATTAVHLQNLTIYRTAGQRMIEIRHAVRGSTQAMVGCTYAAMGIYEQVRNKPELAQRELLGKSFARNLENATIAAGQAVELLEEARWAHTSTVDLTLDLGEHPLPTMIEEVVRFARLEALRRRSLINVDDQLPDGEKHIICDRPAILLVLHNIIENAIRYSYPRKPIQVRAWKDDQAWFVGVTNISFPIPQDRQQEIFQPFKRYVPSEAVERRAIDNSPGTGLGLAICRRIIATHDSRGEILVESLPGPDERTATNTFTIILPSPSFSRRSIGP